MHLQCTMSSIFDWEVRRMGMRERVKTQNDNGLRIWIFSQKLPFSVGKKMFQRQIQEVQYNIVPISHITYITDFVWFQRSCGSMKLVSFLSSIDNRNKTKKIQRQLKKKSTSPEQMYQFLQAIPELKAK